MGFGDKTFEYKGYTAVWKPAEGWYEVHDRSGRYIGKDCFKNVVKKMIDNHSQGR